MTDDTNKPAVRDATGRFLPGNQLSRGHRAPQILIAQQYRRTLAESVGTEKFAEVVRRHVDLILEASPKEAGPLIELLYSYMLGKPQQSISLDVSTDQPPALPSNLDAEDIRALRRIRDKMGTAHIEVDEAEVLDADVIPAPPRLAEVLDANEPAFEFLADVIADTPSSLGAIN
jgi:hypothetical protein